MEEGPRLMPVKDPEARRAYSRAWRKANPDKSRAIDRRKRAKNYESIRISDSKRKKAKYVANIEQSRADNRQKQRDRRAANPQVAAYLTQKSHAKSRGIPFLLTFDEWWEVWFESGKWNRRGRRRDQFVMARHGDIGPYANGNVRICSIQENVSEWAENLGEDTRKRMSERQRDRKWSAETRKKMLGRTHSHETRERMRIAQAVRRQRERQHDESGL
jgi:hypothetical protein